MRTLSSLSLSLLTMATITVLSGCAVGPDFKKPQAQVPADWSSLRAGDASLHDAVPPAGAAIASAEWWKPFGDPVLDGLEADAATANPDLQTAALRFAESRAQRQTAAAQRGPQVDMTASAQRQRPSENGATSRTIDVLAPADQRDTLVKLLSQPYTIYQGGFDASWEPDFWGRVRRSVEAADAQVSSSGALFDGARLDVAADVARVYFALRGTQRQIALTRADLDAAQDHFTLMKARADGGMASDLDTTQQQALLADLRARLPALLAEEANALDQLSVLIGQTPGSLQARLAPLADADTKPVLPSLALGIPSDVVRRRPDIRQAEAQLHEATANTGVAVADLYPRITLGGSFAFESLQSGDFGDWGSRHWSIGPSLDLPIFDMGRRRSVVTLRKLQQQEAAVAWQKSVLQAWSDIDTALNAYSAERQRNAQLAERERLSRDAYSLADVRYRNGRTTFIEALDAERTLLAAQRDRADSDAQLAIRLVAIYKAIGGGDVPAAAVIR
jgi:NodT family efflux transporter outer membrane factor (OMF) lipoprotein